MSNPEAPSGAFWAEPSSESASQRYRSLVNAVGDGLYRLDGDGRIVGANDALVETTGYSRRDLHGEHVSLLLSDADVERIERELSGTDETTVSVDIATADGDAVSCELRVTSTGDGQVGVVRDNSVQETRDAARTPQGSITDVIDEADIGMFVLDEAFDVAWADETVEQYFGLDRDTLIGRDKRAVVTEQMQTQVEEPEQFTETVLATYDDNSYVEQFECHVVPSAGREGRWLEHYSKPIESGSYAGGRIELYYDITERKESEGSLRDTVEQFESLVDAVEEYAIFRLDTDGTVISWNEGAAAIKGYDADEILGKHFSTFYTEEDRASGVPEYNLEQASEHGSVGDEGWRVRQDGSRFWANVTITEVRDDDGTHRGYLKVTRDMTDRHMRERELESELERVLGRISDAFYAVDEEFQFTHVNKRAEQLLGYSAEELEGTVMWDVFPAPSGSALYDQFRHAMEDQEPVSFERYVDTLGIWAEVNVYPSETGLSVYLLDVTDRKEREQELRRTERRFEAVFEDPNILVGLLEPDGTVRDINQTAMEYIDADLADVRSEPFWETPWWGTDGDVRTDVREWTERAAAGEYVEFEADITGPDGERTISGFFRPVVDDHGDVVSIIVSDRDVTERREYERKLEESNERLEQFAYAASHDLQEPLRMVSSYLQLLENRYGDLLDEDGEEFLAFAVDGADRMKAMIDGLLEYSRIETRGNPMEPTDLESVLDDVRTDLQFRIEETDAAITSDSLPTVVGDEDQLRQVFQNLIENAIEYSGDGPPQVHISAEREGDRWRLAVEDEGIGIDPDDQERVFEVFERLHARDEHDGTGIGLALCKRIVERHGGEITIESDAGEDATFAFSLPAPESATN